jgi:glycosyltransferase involved in cell wall biosynthesis
MPIVYLQPRSLTESPNSTEFQIALGILAETDSILACAPECYLPIEVKCHAKSVQVFGGGPHSAGRGFRSLRSLLASIKMVRSLPRNVETVTVCSNSDLWSLAYGLAHSLNGARWVIFCWDHPFIGSLDQPGPIASLSRRLKSQFVRRCFLRADKLILIIHPELLRELKINHQSPKLHRNGVDIKRITTIRTHNPSAQPLIGVSCNISAGKGLEVLVAALRIVHERIPEVRLRLIGEIEPAYYEHLTSLMEPDSLNSVTDFTGLLSFEESLAQLSECWVCVCPYPATTRFKYNYALKLGEYLALGKPVVAVDTPGSRWYIQDSVNGLLVRSGMHQEMADALTRLLTDGVLRQTLGAKARLASEHYKWEDIHRAIVAEISELDGVGSS